MPSINKVIVMGNITRDPQQSFLPSQTPVVEFGLAMNHKYKKQDGTQVDDTCFVDCQLFGKRAEVVNKYFKKGDPIFIEGRLRFESWQAQDGTKKSKLRVLVENFEFVGSKKTRDDDPPPLDQSHPVFEQNSNDDDIPF